MEKLDRIYKWFLIALIPIAVWSYFAEVPIGNYIIEHPFIYCPIIWMLYAIAEGKLHAYYYAHEINSQLKESFNEHSLFVIMRLCVFVPLWDITNWKVAACLFVMQPFFHNGSYYHHRNLIDKSYPKGWFDQSKTSTALSTKYLTPVVRILLAIAGLTGLIFLQ